MTTPEGLTPDELESRARQCDDPVHQDADGSWYFWEETWAHRQGPFASEAEARTKVCRYAAWLCREDSGGTCGAPAPEGRIRSR